MAAFTCMPLLCRRSRASALFAQPGHHPRPRLPPLRISPAPGMGHSAVPGVCLPLSVRHLEASALLTHQFRPRLPMLHISPARKTHAQPGDCCPCSRAHPCMRGRERMLVAASGSVGIRLFLTHDSQVTPKSSWPCSASALPEHRTIKAPGKPAATEALMHPESLCRGQQ